jgi:hypothetical protein
MILNSKHFNPKMCVEVCHELTKFDATLLIKCRFKEEMATIYF